MASQHHPAESTQQRQIRAHVMRVIECSIEARVHDLAGHPAAARDASLDAAANARWVHTMGWQSVQKSLD